MGIWRGRSKIVLGKTKGALPVHVDYEAGETALHYERGACILNFAITERL